MALSYKARRRGALLALVIGLPLYVVVAVSVVNWAEGRWGTMPWWFSLVVYVVLGMLWIVPLKPVFTGIGKEDPDAPSQD